MARDKIITGVDIGTQSVKAVIAKKKYGNERLQIVGVGVVPSFGIRKGIIVDIEESARSVKLAIAEAERLSGVSVDGVIANLDGSHILSKMSKGVVAVSRADQEISDDDIKRVLSAAEAVSIPANKEILHVVPREFIVDGEMGIKDPLGMHGVRLELNALIIECSTPVVKNVQKCIEAAGYDLDNIILSPLASAKSALTKRQMELGVLVLDIGGSTTGVAVYEDGDIVHAQILPIGSAHITNDIAIGLRTDIDVAEKIKIDYGMCLPEEVSKKEVIDLAKAGHQEPGQAMRKDVAEIIEARLEEIFDLANKELKKIGKQSLLPAGVVLLGGGAKLPGIIELAKKSFKLPAQIGFPIEVDGLVDQIEDPSFATAIGLIKWDSDVSRPTRAQYGMNINVLARIKKMFNSLMP